MIKLHLYSTVGCHLCERAMVLLKPLLSKRIELKEIDIVDSDELLDRYGISIPVIQRLDNKRELFWPFDSAQLEDFLL
jgi:glutaredoxin